MRATVLVIDSFGIGALPDAHKYGDSGANTALHICQRVHGDKWPQLKELGLGNAAQLIGPTLPGVPPSTHPLASFGIMEESSPGKDTTTGHWELAGLPLKEPFHQFPKEYPSFPDELISDFLKETGCKGILGNKSASGTTIIEELGIEHIQTRFPICYTSADSVFQIACHTSVFSIKELFGLCEVARKLCDKYSVGRVIARPFEGEPGSFKRTADRHDYSIALPGKTVLDELQAAGVKTIAVGKIGAIFKEQGIDESHHDSGNKDCLKKTEQLLKSDPNKKEFIFVNLVDTDMLYGHRRDIQGYFESVKEIDSYITLFIKLMDNNDLLIITADHGCDPSFKGTDHTREHVPILAYKKGTTGSSLGVTKSFTTMAKILKEYFEVE